MFLTVGMPYGTFSYIPTTAPPANLQVHVSHAPNTQLNAQYWPPWHVFFNRVYLTFVPSLPF